jgi:hypothetical protein
MADTEIARRNPHHGKLSDRSLDALLDACSAGITPRQLAYRLHPHNPAKRRRTFRRIVHHMLHDPRVADGIRDEVTATLMVGLAPAARGLNARSKNRNVQAVKLLLEATGVYNSRVKHEHSGEITVKFDIPRPTFEDAGVVDADVVE